PRPARGGPGGARRPRAGGGVLHRGGGAARGRGRAEVRRLLGPAAGDGAGGARPVPGGRAVSRLALQALGAAAEAVDGHVPALVEEQFASRLLARDATLWGPAAEAEASRRLAWVDLYRTSRPLVGEVEALADQVRGRGLDRVVLCGMGGSSLAP